MTAIDQKVFALENRCPSSPKVWFKGLDNNPILNKILLNRMTSLEVGGGGETLCNWMI